MRCLFVYPLGKSASETGKLLGAVNETTPEKSKMHAKTNEQSAVEVVSYTHLTLPTNREV